MSDNKILRILQTIWVSVVGLVSPSFAQTLFLVKKLDEEIKGDLDLEACKNEVRQSNYKANIQRLAAEALRYRQRSKDADKQLKAAADVFAEIDRMAENTDATFWKKIERMQELAQNGYRAATK